MFIFSRYNSRATNHRRRNSRHNMRGGSTLPTGLWQVWVRVNGRLELRDEGEYAAMHARAAAFTKRGADAHLLPR